MPLCFPRRNREKTTGDWFGPFPLIRPVPFGWLYCGTERLQEFSRRGRLRSWLLAWAAARVHLALCVRRFALQRQGHHLRGAQRRRLVQFRLSPRCRDDMGRRRSLCSTTLTHICKVSLGRVFIVGNDDRAPPVHGWKSKINVAAVSVFAGSYFHSFRATSVASTKTGCPPTMFVLLTLPSGPIMTSTFTVPTNLICFAISGYRGVGLEIAFRASCPDMLAPAAHKRTAAQMPCLSLISVPLGNRSRVFESLSKRHLHSARGRQMGLKSYQCLLVSHW